MCRVLWDWALSWLLFESLFSLPVRNEIFVLIACVRSEAILFGGEWQWFISYEVIQVQFPEQCVQETESTYVCSSHAVGPRVGLCSLTVGAAQCVILAHLSSFCRSWEGPTSGSLPFWPGFLAWLPSTGAVAHKSSSTVSRTNLEVHTLVYLLV